MITKNTLAIYFKNFGEYKMKKLLIAAAIAATTVSMSANAFWDDGNSNTNWNGGGYNNMNNNAYGNGYGNGWGDGSGDMDADGDFEITIKARGRGRGKGNTRASGNGNAYGNGYNNWDNRMNATGDQRYMNNSGHNGYNPYYNQYFVPQQAPQAVAPAAVNSNAMHIKAMEEQQKVFAERARKAQDANMKALTTVTGTATPVAK